MFKSIKFITNNFDKYFKLRSLSFRMKLNFSEQVIHLIKGIFIEKKYKVIISIVKALNALFVLLYKTNVYLYFLNHYHHKLKKYVLYYFFFSLIYYFYIFI